MHSSANDSQGFKRALGVLNQWQMGLLPVTGVTRPERLVCRATAPYTWQLDLMTPILLARGCAIQRKPTWRFFTQHPGIHKP